MALAACRTANEGDSSEDAPSAAGLGAIGFYQDHVGHQWGFHCDFEPSCSEFGKQAVQRHGLWKGSLMIADRLMRDHGLDNGPYGVTADGRPFDPVPAAFRREAQEDNPQERIPPRQNRPGQGRQESDADSTAHGQTVDSPGAKEASEASPEEPREQASRAQTAGASPLGDAEPKGPSFRADAQYSFAESLHDQEEWRAAAVEWSRYLHWFPDDPRTGAARRQLSVCHSRSGRHELALESIAALATPERDLLGAYLLREAGRRHEAVQWADVDTDEGQLLAGLLSMERRDLSGARGHFQRLPDSQREFLLTRVDQMEALPRKSPALAGTLSAVLPGSGQLYAGRSADALVALLTNGVLIGGTWSALHNEEDVTAGALALLAVGFYTGNIYGGINAARQRNHSINERAMNETRGLLRDRRFGLGIHPLQDGGAISLYLRF